MKTQSPRRHRSVVKQLFPFIALLGCLGCETASQPVTSPSADNTSSQQAPAADQEASEENGEALPQTDDAASEDNTPADPPNAAEGVTDSATPAGPPAVSKSPVMSAEAFLRAAGEGRTEDVKRALDSGMNIEAAEAGREHTALHHAAYDGHTETVLFLIKRGATVDSRDHEGKTPLIHACTGPFPETVQALIKAGADVNAKGATEGFTPLMMAAGLDQLKTVQILLENGANKDAVDEDNDKAIDHARRAGLTQIVKVLE